MPQANPYSAYERTNVETADQRQLILMLYDGAIRFMSKGAARIEANDIEAAHNYLVRSREIVSELLATLKPEKAGEVGTNLQRLYVYVFNRLVHANHPARGLGPAQARRPAAGHGRARPAPGQRAHLGRRGPPGPLRPGQGGPAALRAQERSYCRAAAAG